MLEGDDLTIEHFLWPKMLGDTQLLDPTEGNDHDYFIVGGKKRARGLQGEKKAKNSDALVETKGGR
jgi:hypothetical protein